MHHLCRDPLREALAFTSVSSTCQAQVRFFALPRIKPHAPLLVDRKSTRLNSSHSQISYAVFCLKKKKHDIVVIHLFSEAISARVVRASLSPKLVVGHAIAAAYSARNLRGLISHSCP